MIETNFIIYSLITFLYNAAYIYIGLNRNLITTTKYFINKKFTREKMEAKN